MPFTHPAYSTRIFFLIFALTANRQSVHWETCFSVRPTVPGHESLSPTLASDIFCEQGLEVNHIILLPPSFLQERLADSQQQKIDQDNLI